VVRVRDQIHVVGAQHVCEDEPHHVAG